MPGAPIDAGVPGVPGDARAHARLQGKRVALGLVSAVAVVFVALSAVQIVPAIFGVGATPLPATAPGTDARTCADGVRKLESALERAQGAAGSPSFQAALEP